MNPPDDDAPPESPTDVSQAQPPLQPPSVLRPLPASHQSPDAESVPDSGSIGFETLLETGTEDQAQTEAVPWVEGSEQSVDHAAVTMQRWIRLSLLALFVVPAGLILTLIAVAGGLPMWVYVRILVGLAVLATGLGFLAWRWPLLHHRHLSYRVDPGGLQIRHGVLWRRLTSIPITRVQHVDVTQGPGQRYFDLATLTIHTAGTEGASIPLSGLHHNVALKLRDHLLPANRRGLDHRGH
ncbi:MAG: PH domain-containing protein [Thermoanaerobaculia bacterium]|nr:PH domain-containing protein [Thermoanaerobaculia bacterium]